MCVFANCSPLWVMSLPVRPWALGWSDSPRRWRRCSSPRGLWEPPPGRCRCRAPAGSRSARLRFLVPRQTRRGDTPRCSERCGRAWTADRTESALSVSRWWTRVQLYVIQQNRKWALTLESLLPPFCWPQSHRWTRRRTASVSDPGPPPGRSHCVLQHACPRLSGSSPWRTCRGWTNS